METLKFVVKTVIILMPVNLSSSQRVTPCGLNSLVDYILVTENWM